MPTIIALPVEFARKPAAVCATETARFTLDGSDELENHLARICEKILVEVQKIVPSRKLEALLLGGGYGRGEGGVLKTESGDRPYNDLEFYVFIRGNNWLNERRFGEALRYLAHELTPEAEVEVEFKIISSAKLRRSPASMFYYDLVAGHRWIFGDEKLLVGCGHHCGAQNIPLSEATRLLMNRCTGLLFAREKLQQEFFTGDDADFVCRNLAKAQLALGDVLLTAFGQYHWSCLERHERLKTLSATQRFPWLGEVYLHHAMGMKFKLHPARTSITAKELQSRHNEISGLALQLWLWVEGRRLGRRFHCPREYASSLEDKFPGANPWRNLLLNAKTFGPAAFFQKSRWRHPRERILNALALLLWQPSASNSELQHWLRGEPRRPADGEANPVKIYQALWHQFN